MCCTDTDPASPVSIDAFRGGMISPTSLNVLNHLIRMGAVEAMETAAWTSNAVASNLASNALSGSDAYASNTASFASNALSNVDIAAIDFASNMSVWSSNTLSNVDSKLMQVIAALRASFPTMQLPQLPA